MNQSIKLPFLGEQPKLSFKKKRSLLVCDLYKEVAPSLLTEDFAERHEAELLVPLFEFTVDNSTLEWTIVKTFEEFLNLRESLVSEQQSVLLPIPVQTIHDITPSMYDSLMDFFVLFLDKLANEPAVTKEPCFRRFVYRDVPHESKDLKVYYQGYMEKRAWGRHDESTLKKIFQFLGTWEERLFTISSEGVSFADEQKILDNLMFSTTFSYHCGRQATGNSKAITINSSHRKLSIRGQNIHNMIVFFYFLNKAYMESQNTVRNRYESFATVRNNCAAKYYIDGQGYFSDLCDALLSAKKEVFICSWMLSPYFSLKRPDPKGQYRLDNVMQKIAKAGIKITIVLYNAPTIALNTDTGYSKDYLTSLSNNIKIIVHPNYILIPFLWSHHQKLVIVDQKVAYMGGLDIGYGRMDNGEHSLKDEQEDYWPGVDYCNYRDRDIIKPRQYQTSSINRKKEPRMPWHDIAVRLTGPSVLDLSRHFIQYWNYVNFQLDMSDRQLLMYVGLTQKQLQTPEQPQKPWETATPAPSVGQRSYRGAVRLSNEDTEDFFMNYLPDVSFYKQNKKKKQVSSAIFQTEKPSLQNQSQGKKAHRSTIFDLEDKEGTRTQEMSYYAQCLQAIGGNLNLNEQPEQKQEEVRMPEQSSPRMQEEIDFKSVLGGEQQQNRQSSISSCRMATSFDDLSLLDSCEASFLMPKQQRTQIHQIMRSSSMWSTGLSQNNTQHSILNAYKHLISTAKECIYIENQFFISEENGIADAIADKIIFAHENKQRFRVIVLLPALPGFDGNPADQSAAVFRVQVDLHLKTISYLYEKIQHIPGKRQYIYFFSLRNHAVISGKPVTEIIYIHSKLMIVDDRVALIGSANINDRSMLGNRDSQLAVTVEESEFRHIQLKSGGVREVGDFAHRLRVDLYREHFGLSEQSALDYYDDDVWDAMIEQAKVNHKIYRQLFGCYPDDQMDTFQKMEEIKNKANSQTYSFLSQCIKCHAIPFQKGFLRKQDLSLKPSQKEYYVPSINFT